MAFSLTDIRNSIKNLIVKNNVTTSAYYISSGLQKKVADENIIAGYSKESMPNIQFPFIWVELLNKTEEQRILGRRSNRDITMNFRIRCITDYGYGQFDGRQESDTEMLKLANNIENLFRNNIKISNTCEWAIITGTEYDVVEFNDTYNSSSDISLQVYKITS